MKLTQILFRSLYVLALLLSLFTVLAPREYLARTYVHVWGWLVLMVPVWWLAQFVRALYRGGE